MTGARTMLSLAKDYLSERRALGFALRMEGHQITAFALFADERGHSGPLTNDIVLNWVQGQAKRASPF
ncbi:MAG: integrase, partial [Mesorhizobium sp.]